MNNSYKYISKYMLKWLIISSIVGVGGGLSAYALTTLIKVISNKSDFFPIWIAPVIGGIIVSIIYLWDKKAAGFGTDHYIVAGNSNTIRLKIKTYFSKLAATVVTLGFKGSGGVEGPMLVIGGSLSDGISKIPILKHRLSKDDYRTLVICGAAGAIGAVFKSPLAGGILAVELLYKTSLHYSDLFPAMLSSTMGFVIYSMLAGAEPIFTIPDYLPNPFNVPLFILAGILGGISSILFMYIFRKANEVFGKMKYKNIHPIIGGFLTGLVLLLVPQAGGTGTSVIQEMINNNLPIVFLLVLLLGKILATTFTVGSGGFEL